MNDDAVNRLIDELGATQILLAEALIELEYKGTRPTAKGIARAWLRATKIHYLADWTTGAKAIHTYLLANNMKGVDEALNIIFPTNQKYFKAIKQDDPGIFLVCPLPESTRRTREFLREEYLKSAEK